MTNTKATKRALVASALSVLLCFSMLVGSTFAWFTDSASTSVNKIQAGNLDVTLEYYDTDIDQWVDAVGKSLEFQKNTGMQGVQEVLWEPGCTYNLPTLRITNNDNLALKYDIVLTGIDGDAKLNEAIEWTYSYSYIGVEDWGYGPQEFNGTYVSALDGSKKLLPKDSDKVTKEGMPYYNDLVISGHMDQDAGNEYQGLSIDGISITVIATQVDHEVDSYNSMYDIRAEYPISENINEAIANAKAGDTVSLASGNYTLPNYYTNGMTVDGNGATVSLPLNEGNYNRINTKGTTFTDITFVDPVTLTGGATFINCTFEKGWSIVTATDDITLINCTFEGKMHIDSGTGAKLVAENTQFKAGITAKLGAGGTFSFKDCSFAGTVWSNTNATLYNAASFDNCTFTLGSNTSNVYLPNNEPVSLVTAENCQVIVSHGTSSTNRTYTTVG